MRKGLASVFLVLGLQANAYAATLPTFPQPTPQDVEDIVNAAQQGKEALKQKTKEIIKKYAQQYQKELEKEAIKVISGRTSGKLSQEEAQQILDAYNSGGKEAAIEAAKKIAYQKAAEKAKEVLAGKIPGLSSSEIGALIDAAIGGNLPGVLKGILTQKAMEYLQKVLNQILAKYGVKIPPDYTVGVPEVVVIGGKPYKTGNDEVKPVDAIDATGETIPNQKTVLYCLKHKGSKECKKHGITRATDTAGAVGATLHTYSTKTNREIKKEIIANVETLAATSLADVDDKNEAELLKAFNQRGVFLKTAAISYSDVPLGKEFADNLPPEAKKYYNFLALQQTAKDVFIKSHLRRMQLHYKKLLSLKRLIEQTCNADFSTPPPTCSFGNPGSALKNAVSSRSQPSASIPTRSCCGCTAAAWKAAGHTISAISSRIQQAESILAATMDKDTQLIISTIRGEECLTRQTIWKEMNQTRIMQKTLACLQLKLELERLMLEIDRYEVAVAQAAAGQTKIQNENYKLMEKAIRKAERSGYELVK